MEKYKYRLFVRHIAEIDIQEILFYYEKISANLSSRFIQEIFDVFDVLKQNPFIFVVKYKNTRIAFLKKFPNGVHYKIDGSKIHVLTILHTKRKSKF